MGNPVGATTPWTLTVERNPVAGKIFAPYMGPDSYRTPYWLQPETYYTGAAWYLRDAVIPAHWTGMPVSLFLERPHWQTTVWIDDKLIGTNDSLYTPHLYQLGGLTPGRHRLAIRVDNSLVIDVGTDSRITSGDELST